MKANDLRKLYLDFFKSKKHKIIASAPIVVKNDPTLMFTNAGMNQFKDVFLGDFNANYSRIVNSQKCLRVSGKHNDLEEVGHDTYHHTMFEMLGSWSFGDYFKEEAIDLAWEFLINVCHLDKGRIYVTVFEGSKEGELSKDHEAFAFWKKYLPEDRILNGNKKDNFWEMGETGPCGPCSEIHFDNRKDKERRKISGQLLVNKDHPQVIEIWNLVFIQYNRFSDGSLILLPNYHVDTGMGFERLTMIIQGVSSNYDTDIFQPIIQKIATKANLNYGEREQQDIAMRVIADHIRAITFSIADGQLPSNVKAGYVIRRILRRAVRYAYTFLNLQEPFMHGLVSILVSQMGSQFPELIAHQDIIKKVVKEEESTFLRTLDSGLKRINQIIQNTTGQISGKQVFELYDTYGFPIDLTALILNEQKLSFNKEDFNIAMQKQQDRSKQAGKLERGDWVVLIKDEEEGFAGYSTLEEKVNITRYREIKSKDSLKYQLVFNITPFFPEGGGQVGDTGVIKNMHETISIINTKKENKLIVHFVDKLPEHVEMDFIAKVNVLDRKSSARNHTATHLLQESLKDILGEHVTQKGSLVNPDYLRFDFTHFSKITKNDLQKIEADVNSKILANISLNEHVNLPLIEAEALGAIMPFGEKYGDLVRMIQFDTSKELCGGTHVNATGEIGVFKILHEGSVASGIRRIEAKTGINALNYLNQRVNLLDQIGSLVKNNDVKSGITQLLQTNKKLEKKIIDLKKLNSDSIKEDLLSSAVDINGMRFIAKEVSMDAKEMKDVSFQLRNEQNLVLVLGSKAEEKPLLSVMLTDDVVLKGINAVSIIRDISKEISGGGGGQVFFATAGGSNIRGMHKAFEKARDMIK